MTSTTLLKAWSISKTFTHMALLQFVVSGQLRLDQTLNDLEQAYPNLYQGYVHAYPKSEKITLRHLLSHTSGIVDYMTLPEFLNNWQQSRLPGEIIRVASQHQDQIEPGTVTRYSNTTMMILARIIEELAGEGFDEYLSRKLLLGTGLTQSYLANDLSGWGATHGYRWADHGQFVEATDRVSPSIVWGTGAIVTTASQLGKWFASILSCNVLPPAMIAEVFKPVRLADDSDAEYGLGFHLQRFPNGFHLYGHGGGPLEGNSATMLYSPQLQTTIVVMVNGSSPTANQILGTIGWRRTAEYLKNRQ
jgi:D-alanyl-D-alanine carboxypeptidase